MRVLGRTTGACSGKSTHSVGDKLVLYQYQPLNILEWNYLAIQCVSSEVDISAEECSTASIMPLLGVSVNVATRDINLGQCNYKDKMNSRQCIKATL